MPAQAPSMASRHRRPEDLEPSELGTKQYWEDYYEEDLATLQDQEGREEHGESPSTWFEDVNAPQKILEFLLSEDFPLAPSKYLSSVPNECPSVLDVGTGNGQTLFQLRLQGNFRGPMVGIDYSEASIQLARRLGQQNGCQDIKLEMMEVLRDDPRQQEWWAEDGFDLVLDKGTFDAISLSEEVAHSSTPTHRQPHEAPVRIHTLYPSRALRLVKPGGFLLVTSCNWTQEELIHWFTARETGSEYGMAVWKTIEYPKFKFGGHEGQGVCTVCFRKVSMAGEG